MLKTIPSLKNLIKLFLLLEWRQKYAVQGVLVQMFTSVLIIYLSLEVISLPVWNTLFWLMIVFNTMNTIAKGFLQESEGKMLYYHSICKPETLIASKIIFNVLVSLTLLLIFALAYAVVLDFKVQNYIQYLVVAVFFTIGLSTVFTLVSAIASGAGNNTILISVIGLPLILPILLITIKSAKKALDGIETNAIYYDITALALMDVMVIYLAVLLYKYLWKN